MKPIILPITLGLLCSAFTLAPDTKKENSPTPAVTVSPVNTVTSPDACAIFTSIQLDQYGLSEDAFIYAWKGYQHLKAKNKIELSHSFENIKSLRVNPSGQASDWT